MGKPCKAVFAGGGVRGIGHVGAVAAAERVGYEFTCTAGSSAGAIVAALIAAGYGAEELHKEMMSIDYMKFKQEDRLDRLCGIGKIFSILINYGIYNADYFEQWMSSMLKKKGVETFGDLPDRGENALYRLQVTVTDLFEKRVLVFPKDLKLFGIDPMSYPIARAVRMSMSIPIFYEPFKMKDTQGRVHYMVDGGFVSNYPMWILDDEAVQADYPTFGFRFFSREVCTDAECRDDTNLVSYCEALVSTMMDGYDSRFEKENGGDDRRCIWIPTGMEVNGKVKDIGSVDFGITNEESELLYKNGYRAGQSFFASWSFEAWRRMRRR